MENKNDIESQTIRWSIAVLCISLFLVYIVLYFSNKDLFKSSMQCEGNKDIVVSQIGSGVSSGESTYLIDGSSVYMSGKNNLSGLHDDSTGNMLEFGSDNTLISNYSGGGMQLLSGTKTYYGNLDFVEKMGISYKYALVDDKGIYYLNMGDYNYDFSDIARKLGGNLYIMNTEQELIANSMFGDKVTYINLPEYKNSKVLILLDINDQSWLLAIDYSIYHQVKSYLKSLFIY